jgi:MOSC domain-containing protein YiiM
VEWIGLRTGQRRPVVAVEEATVEPGNGLVGDRYRSTGAGKRAVTLITAESLATLASHLGREAVDPALVRRNVVVSGINLLALKGRSFRLGSAVLETTDECHPCSRMEEALGPGGYNAMRGLGGVAARVLEGGTVRVGDTVVRL